MEALLAEKARLAHENETYARENRFLREIVEYHQLTMQDVVYLDNEGMEEEEEDTQMDQNNQLLTTLSSTPSSPKYSDSPPYLKNDKQKEIPNRDNNDVSEKSSVETSNASFNIKEDQKTYS